MQLFLYSQFTKLLSTSTFLLLWVEEGDDDDWGEEVDDGGAKHHVERALGPLIKGYGAPGGFFELNIIVFQVINLSVILNFYQALTQSQSLVVFRCLTFIYF